MYGNVNQILDNAVKENGSVNSGYEYEYGCKNSNPIPTSSGSPQDDLIMYGDGDGSYNGEGESTELVLNDQVHGQADVLITPRTRTKMHDIRRSGDFDSTDFNLSSIGWEIWGKFEVDGCVDSCVDLECLPRVLLCEGDYYGQNAETGSYSR